MATAHRSKGLRDLLFCQVALEGTARSCRASGAPTHPQLTLGLPSPCSLHEHNQRSDWPVSSTLRGGRALPCLS